MEVIGGEPGCYILGMVYSHIMLSDSVLYCAGPKPPLELPWFSATDFLYGDLMLATIDT